MWVFDRKPNMPTAVARESLPASVLAMTASTMPAMATEPPVPSVTESIQAVAGVDEDLLADPVSESRSPVDVPDDSNGMVDFDGTDFAIGLPGDQDADATRRGDTVVFSGTDAATSTVVTPTAEGVQIMTVLDSQAADSCPTYELELPVGGTANTLPDGSILVSDASGAPAVVIAAPWAQDASGRDLPTHYTIAGDQLAQHTDTQGASTVLLGASGRNATASGRRITVGESRSATPRRLVERLFSSVTRPRAARAAVLGQEVTGDV